MSKTLLYFEIQTSYLVGRIITEEIKNCDYIDAGNIITNSKGWYGKRTIFKQNFTTDAYWIDIDILVFNYVKNNTPVLMILKHIKKMLNDKLIIIDNKKLLEIIDN